MKGVKDDFFMWAKARAHRQSHAVGRAGAMQDMTSCSCLPSSCWESQAHGKTPRQPSWRLQLQTRAWWRLKLTWEGSTWQKPPLRSVTSRGRAVAKSMDGHFYNNYSCFHMWLCSTSVVCNHYLIVISANHFAVIDGGIRNSTTAYTAEQIIFCL